MSYHLNCRRGIERLLRSWETGKRFDLKCNKDEIFVWRLVLLYTRELVSKVSVDINQAWCRSYAAAELAIGEAPSIASVSLAVVVCMVFPRPFARYKKSCCLVRQKQNKNR